MYVPPCCVSGTFVVEMYLLNYFLVSADIKLNEDQCLQKNGAFTLTCTVDPLTTAIEWRIDSFLKATCSNLADSYCLPPGETTIDPRHHFSSVVANKQFTFKTDPVDTTLDAGEYQCVHGIESKTVTLAICGKFSYISNLICFSP